jgi:hypothetical protein
MGAAPPLGVAVKRAAFACAVLVLVASGSASAQERHAVIISGAAGGDQYAGKLTAWRQRLTATLREKLGFDAAQIRVFAENTADAQPATRERVSAAVEKLAQTTGPQDLVLIVMLGHGSFDGVEAKFNLVGPDLDTNEWRDLIRPLRSRVVIVNTTGGSFPFLERLSGPRRVIVTATETPAQKFDTVFAEHFINTLADTAADLDKDGRISLLEAFSGASRSVKQHYERAGQLPIERAMLDDNGDGIGKWAGGEGADGATAARTFLDGAETSTPADPVLAELLQRRAALVAQIDDLRARKVLMPSEEYMKEFERVMIELARVSREIRRKKS